jgi:hypothetical protein
VIVQVAATHHVLFALSPLEVLLLHQARVNVQRSVPLSPSLQQVLDARGDTEARALHTIGKSVAQGGTLGDIGRRGDGRVEGGGWEGIEAGEWEG